MGLIGIQLRAKIDHRLKWKEIGELGLEKWEKLEEKRWLGRRLDIQCHPIMTIFRAMGLDLPGDLMSLGLFCYCCHHIKVHGHEALAE